MLSGSTIFAVSSGSPPAAIAVLRISGERAGAAIQKLAGRRFVPRRASLATLKSSSGAVLDQALVLWFPGPNSATGEDCAEIHCHGGRAVVSAISAELAAIDGLRAADAGEFTRRAFANGRLDLAEAEGLADLLEAETELQRQAANAQFGGALSSQVSVWRDTVLQLSAQLEAALDFSDEDDVTELPESFTWNMRALIQELNDQLSRPRAEKLKDGFRVVLAGPPNTGKSTLFNALIESEAAITSPIAGTTRDVIERSVAIAGIPFSFVDTAGLRDDAAEEIEGIGIERAQAELVKADLVLWLGDEGEGPEGSFEIEARCDDPTTTTKSAPDHRVSALSGEGIEKLTNALIQHASLALPKPGDLALNQRQFVRLEEAHSSLTEVSVRGDLLLKAEALRQARVAFDRLTGRATTEDMLDALFGRFCIGK